jgi:hypothetical protein
MNIELTILLEEIEETPPPRIFPFGYLDLRAFQGGISSAGNKDG